MRFQTPWLVAAVALALAMGALAQPDAPRGERPGGPGPGPRPFEGPGFGGPGFGGPPPGFGPPGGQKERKLVATFDRNDNGRLDLEERKAARELLEKERSEDPRPRFGPRRRGPAEGAPAQPGARISPDQVPHYPSRPLYDPEVVRTIFLQFETDDWEDELSDFYNTDVEVPATMTVDGREYPMVGVHFRGASSFFTVGEGRKRSLNLSVDFVYRDQRLYGHRTLNLLNSHTDPTFLRTVLYSHIAREYIPAPRANHVHVVINGESWGVYVNAEQFNTDFTSHWFGSREGGRWKVPGSPRGHGGLEYLGPDPEPYKEIYDIRSKKSDASWRALIDLCRTLNQTPTDQLAAALAPMLDLDGTLKFLALENALINCDGYWIRASDYNLYRDPKGVFHLIPHDMNETFRAAEGPGMRRRPGAGGGGVDLDPLTGADNPQRPLLHRLLAVPELREKYLGYVREIAERWLDWKTLGPIAQEYQARIADLVKADTRKLYSYEAFERGLTEDVREGGFRGPRVTLSIKGFADARRQFLLDSLAKAPQPGNEN